MLGVLPGIIPVTTAPKPLKLAYIGQSILTQESATTINFGDFTFPNDCLAIACFGSLATNSRVVSSITFGGTAGTLHVTTPSTLTKGGLASRVITAGTYTINVVLNGNGGTSSSHGLGVYALTGYQSAMPVGSNGASGSSGTSVAVSFNLASGGVAVYGALVNNSASTSWSSASQDFTDGSNRRNTWASKINTTAEAPHVETLSWTGSQSNVLVGASWR